MKTFHAIFTQLLKLAVVGCLELALALGAFGQAPAPSGYEGAQLKDWLKANWYDGKHVTMGYDDARRAMYSDIDQDASGMLTCVYTGFREPGCNCTYANPTNAEHTVPQSFFGGSEPMKSDLHHLFPTHGSANSARSNNPFGEVVDSQADKWYGVDANGNYIDPTSVPAASVIDNYSERDGGVFEPREDHKGNVARAVFYFYTMYQNYDINQIGDPATLYAWHLADPVDAEEAERNDESEQYQGNRNPYIDYPEYVALAFGFEPSNGGGGNTGGGSASYCASNGQDASYEWIASVQVGSFTRNNSTSSTGYIDLTSTTVDLTTGSNSASFTPGFGSSSYNEYWKVFIDFNQDGDFDDAGELAFDAGSLSSTSVSGNVTVPSSANGVTTRMRVSMKYNGAQTACESFSYGQVIDFTASISGGSTGGGNTGGGNTGGGSTGSGSELFISEYVEGSSYNKAIEIYNGTGASVSLSDYTLRKQANGAGGWSTMNLSGTLADGQTYVIAHSSASSTLKSKADLTVSNSVVNFNGNDPVALFKGSTLLDIVGTFNGGSGSFAANVTLVRKPSVTAPSSTYSASQWDSNASDDFSDVGTHNGSTSGGSTGSGTTQPAPAPTGYCSAQGNDASYEWIASFSFGSLSNSGSASGYQDFTAQTVTVNPGSSYSVSVAPGFSGSSYQEGYGVWIDLDRDGVFESGEKVFGAGLTSSSVNGTVTIPTSASQGYTRMRVVMDYNNASPSACGSFSYGSVHDYTVLIGGGSVAQSSLAPTFESQLEQEAEIALWPNPTADFANVKAQGAFTATVFDMSGKVHAQVTAEGEASIDVSGLQAGLYLVRVKGEGFEKTLRVVKK